MEKQKIKRLVLDTNVIRYLYYNDNINSSSHNFLNTRLEYVFSKSDEVYLPRIVQIELEFQLKKEGKDIQEWKETVFKEFKTFSIDEKTFYILKTIDELIKETKKTKKYKLADLIILSSIISNFTTDMGEIDGEISFITADLNDFEKGLLDDIFDTPKYENVCYVLQEEKFLNTVKYNAINLFLITFNKLNKKFLDIGESLWWDDILF